MHNLVIPAGAPTHFAGKLITSRWPYIMPASLVIPNGATGQAFENASFLCTLDKPFEAWWMGANVYPMIEDPDDDTASLPVHPILAQQFGDVLDKLVKLKIEYVSLDQKILKSAGFISQLIEKNTRRWPWTSPNTVVRQQGYQVSVDNLAAALGATFATGDWGNIPQQDVASLRVDVEFIGYLLVLEGAEAK